MPVYVGVELVFFVLLLEFFPAFVVEDVAGPHFPVEIGDVVGFFGVLGWVRVVVSQPGFVLEERGGGD